MLEGPSQRVQSMHKSCGFFSVVAQLLAILAIAVLYGRSRMVEQRLQAS
jgi:hypothetical protein